MLVTLVFSVYQLIDILTLSQKRQVIETDKAILGSVQYGIFSVHVWKDKVSYVVNKKIDEFKLNSTNRQEITQRVEEMLYWLLNEVESILNNRAREGFAGWLQSLIASFALDINDLRRRVPDLSRGAVEQLGNDRNISDLKQYLKDRLSEYLDRTIGQVEHTIFDDTLVKYNCDKTGVTNCIREMETSVKKMENDLWKKSGYLLFSCAFMLLLIAVQKKKRTPEIYLLILACLVLLSAGILTPMIDLDARIKEVNFYLMGEPIQFSEQMLFYQSKSIVDIFIVLLHSGQIESVCISLLIIIFSVVFPIVKLFCSFIYLNMSPKAKNTVIDFFVFKSGKWSMADVVVVAVFMAFIGFRGIINTQLAKLSGLNTSIEVITTNDTQLQTGFITFTAFCLMSMFVSGIIADFNKYSSHTDAYLIYT